MSELIHLQPLGAGAKQWHSSVSAMVRPTSVKRIIISSASISLSLLVIAHWWMEPDWLKPPFKKLETTVLLHRRTVEAWFTVQTAAGSATSRRSETFWKEGTSFAWWVNFLKHIWALKHPRRLDRVDIYIHQHRREIWQLPHYLTHFRLFGSPREVIILLQQMQVFARLILRAQHLWRAALSLEGPYCRLSSVGVRSSPLSADVVGMWFGAAKRRRFVRFSVPPVLDEKAQSQPLIYWTQVLIPDVVTFHTLPVGNWRGGL